MNKRFGRLLLAVLTLLALLCTLTMSAAASDDDNSLSSLGITTDGAVLDQEVT